MALSVFGELIKAPNEMSNMQMDKRDTGVCLLCLKAFRAVGIESPKMQHVKDKLV